MIAGRDAVVCPVDCISHGACRMAKAICQRPQSAFLPISTASRSGFERALRPAGGGNASGARTEPQSQRLVLTAQWSKIGQQRLGSMREMHGEPHARRAMVAVAGAQSRGAQKLRRKAAPGPPPADAARSSRCGARRSSAQISPRFKIAQAVSAMQFGRLLPQQNHFADCPLF